MQLTLTFHRLEDYYRGTELHSFRTEEISVGLQDFFPARIYSCKFELKIELKFKLDMQLNIEHHTDVVLWDPSRYP